MSKISISHLLKLLFLCYLVVNLSGLTTDKIIAQSRAEVKNFNGNPTLFINNNVFPPFAYMSYLGEKEYYKEIAATGIHLYNIPSYLGERGINSTSKIGPFRKPIWIGDNEYDFSSLRKDFDDITQSDPEAKVIVRFYLDPPLWWEELHPEASSQLPDGKTFRQCFASEIWRIETGKVLRDCIRWILNSKYSESLVGIHVASGFTEEWFYHPQQYDDENPVRLEAFHDWLKDQYQNDSGQLQKAWNNENITFESAKLAKIGESEKRVEWRNSSEDQNVIDTYRFNAEIMVNNIEYFAKIVKDESNGDLLTGAFYGYHYFVTDPRRGHGGLSKLLESKYIDYLSSPNSYNRVVGEDWPPMVAVQSVKLHGKLWLAENDTRTSITTLLKNRSNGIAPQNQYESGVWLGPKDIETSISFLKKNAGRMLAYGYGGWWFDMWGGWFSDPRLLKVIEITNQLYNEYPLQLENKMHSQVCVIVDEELSFWDANHGTLTNKLLSNRFSLAKSGAPYDLFLRSDLHNISLSQYKVVWLMGLINLKDSEILFMEKWRKQGITFLWTSTNNTKVYKNNEPELFFDDKILWTSNELRDIWIDTGVHVYIDTNDVLYAGNNWISLHTASGGNRTIKLPFTSQIINPISGSIVADSTNTLDIFLNPISTIILRVNPK